MNSVSDKQSSFKESPTNRPLLPGLGDNFKTKNEIQTTLQDLHQSFDPRCSLLFSAWVGERRLPGSPATGLRRELIAFARREKREFDPWWVFRFDGKDYLTSFRPNVEFDDWNSWALIVAAALIDHPDISKERKETAQKILAKYSLSRIFHLMNIDAHRGNPISQSWRVVGTRKLQAWYDNTPDVTIRWHGGWPLSVYSDDINQIRSWYFNMFAADTDCEHIVGAKRICAFYKKHNFVDLTGAMAQSFSIIDVVTDGLKKGNKV